jgi:hypothetical protein
LEGKPHQSTGARVKDDVPEKTAEYSQVISTSQESRLAASLMGHVDFEGMFYHVLQSRSI